MLFQLPKDSVNQRQCVCAVPVAKGQCKSEAVCFVLFQLPKDSVNQRQCVCAVPVAKGQCKSEAVCLCCSSCQRTV